MRHLLAVMSLLVALSSCEKPCEVPAGTYELTYKKLEGDCPDELVTQFDGKQSDLEIEAGVCRRFAFQHSADLPNGCALDTDMSAQLVTTGVEDGQAALTLRCTKPKTYTCRHLFAVEYRRKP